MSEAINMGTRTLVPTQFFIDLIDEAGDKRRFNLAREVAAHLQQQDDRIIELERLLIKHGVQLPPR